MHPRRGRECGGSGPPRVLPAARSRNTPLQPCIEIAIEQGIHEIPHLGLRLSAEPNRNLGRWVDLDGEAVLAVKNLEKQRKALGVGKAVSENLRAPSSPEFVQGKALQIPFVHHALRIHTVDYFP